MSPAYRPVSQQALIDLLVARIADRDGILRVAVDGPRCTEPDELARSLVEPLRALGRPVAQVPAETFWRDASLRLEYGREDPDSLPTWLDAAALRREVLAPIVRSGHYLPSLRDPRTNRATREPRALAEPGTVLIVSGALLLGLGLPFDLSIHLAMSAPARARHTPPELAWTLPAFDRYDAEVDPQDRAEIVVSLNDHSRRPAVAFSDPDAAETAHTHPESETIPDHGTQHNIRG